MSSSIRPIAVALIRRRSDGALLVTGHGMDTEDPRVRPLGGGVEFVFDAELTNTSVEARDHFPVLDAPDEIVFWWRPGDEIARLVPPELTEILAATP